MRQVEDMEVHEDEGSKRIGEWKRLVLLTIETITEQYNLVGAFIQYAFQYHKSIAFEHGPSGNHTPDSCSV